MQNGGDDRPVATVMILGDSLSMTRAADPLWKGPLIGDSDLAVPLRLTYPVLLQTRLSSRQPDLPVYMYNRAGRGYGIRDLLAEVAYNVLVCKPNIVIFHFGANDARFRRTCGGLAQSVPLQEFREHIHQLYEALMFSPARKVFISIAPPTEQLERRRPGYRAEVEAYNAALKAVSATLACEFLDVKDCVTGVDYDDCILADGYHFSAIMHELLARRLEHLLSIMLSSLHS